MRTLLLPLIAVLVSSPLAAQEVQKPNILWAKSYEAAFEQAKTDGKPVVFCIMMQGEVACDRMIAKTYKDPGFIKTSADFVMVPCSQAGVPQFEGITVAEQKACEQAMRDRYVSTEQVISPQHIICDPDGKILVRKRYELSTAELTELMVRALKKFKGGSDEAKKTDEEEAAPGDGPADPGGAAKKADKDVPDQATLDLLEELKRGPDEARLEAARKLIRKENESATEALVEVLGGLSKDIKLAPKTRVDIIRDSGVKRNGHAASSFIKLLESKSKAERNATVVTLEEMASSDATGALLALWEKEKDPEIKKDILRALGPAGEGDDDAKAILIAQLTSSKALLRTAAAMALASHLKADDAVQDALIKLYKKESGRGQTKLAVLYAFHTAKDQDGARKLDPLIAKESDEELRKIMDLVVADVTGREPAEEAQPPARGGAGRRGGGFGGAARAFGGARWQLMRSFYPLFEADKVQRNVVKDILARFQRGR